MELNGFDHFLFFVIGILLPALSLLSARAPEQGLEPVLPAKKHIYFSNGLMLWIGALLVLTNWNLSERSWELLGFRFPITNNTVWLMTSILIIIYIADSINGIIHSKEEEEDKKDNLSKVLPENWREYLPFIFLAFSAGICEEIVFRGFLVNYFMEIFKYNPGGPYLAILIPAVIFSISHLYQGWLNVIKIFSLALLFGGIFLFSQSLLLVVIIHVLVDLISGALVVVMSKRNKQLR